ncbi:ESX secretion-associated protein EspG [Amycolatopsis alkalitolerans]|uniref:ESX secretion-associated protein EspG n=1 Tax=Amycolatopsis alkalitolerans TaxID=2547244 RepID=A0A5C4M3Y2_9PSEU|nr:ESX secretion-associated protein EspG [Amycolatopsis alkalitolerans]TNC27239.1 ESX secretion-associated protein EspG [Amycolatopsis alkalitolerans]
MLNAPIKLATPILLNLIRRRGGEPHPTLSGMAVWYDEDAQRAADQEVNALLTQHGLMGARGMDRGLLDAIESISRPQLEYYGWFEGAFSDAPRKFAVLAGSGAGGAFVLVRDIGEEAVVLVAQRPEGVLAGFIDQIPAARPAPGQPLVTTKAEFLAGRDAQPEGEYTVMRSARDTSRPAPAKEMKRLMEAPRTGAGTLYVAARSRSGSRRRCERPLNFVDTAEGRWLMEERPARGDALVVFTPASPQVLGERLRNAQSALG